ncbi:MAG: 3-deoxy-7-phosphoheptulonate synthase [Dehalococcoidia bacterium]|nr:3-deoxy-7-phosphoheptulonate synthase [Dehalococcoidia bacterium]
MTDGSTSDVRVQLTRPLPTPQELGDALPSSEAARSTVLRGRSELESILAGEDSRLVVITGPCSVHDGEATLEYAGRLRELADRVAEQVLVVIRVYFEKPRTTVGWKGLVYDPRLDGSYEIDEGLREARALLVQINEMGLPAATEFLDPIVPQYFADLISWAAIGARTVESQTHRQMASGLSMPVGIKNRTDGDTAVAIDAIVAARASHGFLGVDQGGRASLVTTTGNPYAHLVLRGGQDEPNYDAASVEAALTRLRDVGLPPYLVVDCSHGNSRKDETRQQIGFRDVLDQRAAGRRGIVGLMLESHLEAGRQDLQVDRSALRYGVSITDACIGWEQTEGLLIEAQQRASTPT